MSFIKKLPHRIYRQYIDYTMLRPFSAANKHRDNINRSSTIAVFSNPRGGSTWLGELLTSLPNSALVYEPLYRGFINTDNVMPDRKQAKSKYIRDLNFYYYQPIPEDAEWAEGKEFFRKLFNREIVPLSMYYENKWEDISKAEHFIFKFCTADLMLPWLVKNFNISPIYLVRHPCGVISSQMQHVGWDNVRNNPTVHIPDFKYNEIYLQYNDILRSIKTPEENLAAFWAIKTKYVIEHEGNNIDWITISYEKLLTDKNYEIDRIFSRLEKPVPEIIWEKYSQPSSSVTKSSLENLKDKNKLESWKKRLTKDQIDRIMNIVREFGIDYYSKDPEPVYNKIYNQA